MSRHIIMPKTDAERRMLDVSRVTRELSRLPVETAWCVSIEVHRPTRSSAQSRYLNGVCYKILGDAIGYERDEVSEFLCGTYWGWKDKKVPKKPSNPTGIESVPVRTTTIDENGERKVISKMEMVDYIAFIHRFAASKGIVIPDPEQEEFA